MKSPAVLVFLALALAGCGTSLSDRSQLSGSLLTKVEASEAHYLERARKNAAFVADCPLEKTSASVVTTKPRSYLVETAGGWKGVTWLNDESTISTIGVAACGQRLLYFVVCGQNEHYGAPGWENSTGASCDVVANAKDQ